jgi:hypothetical protein
MRRVGIALMAVAVMLAACQSAAPEITPDVAVFRWIQAFAAQDGETVAQLSCSKRQTEAQNTRFFQALGVAPPTTGPGGGALGGGGGLPVYDVSGLKYATTFADDSEARVQVTGLLRMASGMVSQTLNVNSAVGLTRERASWRVCGPAAA